LEGKDRYLNDFQHVDPIPYRIKSHGLNGREKMGTVKMMTARISMNMPA